MSNQNYTATFTVDQSPEEVFQAITNVQGWWSQAVSGNTKEQGGEFVFEVPGVHYSKQKLIEVIPDKRIVWLVTEANMQFLKQTDEWVGTKVIFDISTEDGKTKLTFTHEGLKPQVECYKFCMPAWEQYVKGSLYKLITTGQGTPNLEGKTLDKPSKA
jgi:uncharacterized protein YndB with AHSA1/START domain